MKYRSSAAGVVAVMLLSAAAAVQVLAAGESAMGPAPVRAQKSHFNTHGVSLRHEVKVEFDAPFGDQVLPLLQRLVPG